MRARTRDRMLALVRRWETSGETRRAFAQRHGVTLSCFDYWRRQALDARQEQPVGFAPVRVMSEEARPTAAGVLELVFASGERLVICEGASGELVQQIVAAVRASC